MDWLSQGILLILSFLRIVQRCLGEHGFRCSKFPLPVVGEGWGEGAQTGQVCPRAEACIHRG
jgi:hypothetical protein